MALTFAHAFRFVKEPFLLGKRWFPYYFKPFSTRCARLIAA